MPPNARGQKRILMDEMDYIKLQTKEVEEAHKISAAALQIKESEKMLPFLGGHNITIND